MKVRLAVPADAPAPAELGATPFTGTFGHLYSPENLELHLSRVHSVAVHAATLADVQTGVWIAVDETGYAVAYAVGGPCKLPVSNLEVNAGELKQIYVRASHQQ